MFLLATGTTAAATFLAACGKSTTEAAIGDIPVGSAKIVDDVIIAQPTQGQFAAYSTTCPHAGSKINKVSGDTVKCQAHGSIFAIKDGSVIQGPATSPLDKKNASVKGDKVEVS